MSDRYLDAARRVIERAESEEVRGVFDRPCSTCKWSSGADIIGRRWCSNPVVKLAAAASRDTHGRERLQGCDAQRSASSPYGEVVCGPGGSLWEEYVSHMPIYFARAVIVLVAVLTLVLVLL